MKLNLGSSINQIKGFKNLDAIDGWYVQHGLDYPDNSIEAITISHLVMYIKELDIEPFFKEMYRVLEPKGIVRITEDNSTFIGSKIFGGWKDAVMLTSADFLREYLEKVGFKSFEVKEDETHYKDKSLCQRLHGGWPRVYHIEGLKLK